MARSSDFTYLSRAVFTCWTFLWFLQHVWNIDRFEALRWGRIKKHDLKSVITVLLVIMCPLQAFYDISSAIIKYQEGFFVNPLNGEIVNKPNEFFSESDKKLIVPINYVLCGNFSLQTCLLFLLQSFWNYLAKNLAKTSFMGSFEFRSYIVYAIFSIFIFPCLQYFFRDDLLLTEALPQLAYSVFMFLIALFGLRSHRRFTKLLHVTRKSSTSQINILLKLEYFRDMNRYLTSSLFVGSISLMILSIDALTPKKFINTHKFPSDFLICQLSFSIWIVFVTLILIFYPSTSTLSDAAMSSTIQKPKSDLEPPTPHWLTEGSQWSSQASSQQTNSQPDNSYSVDVYGDVQLPPPVTLDIPPTPPSPYRPNAHNISIPLSQLPPPPINPPPKSKQKITTQPSITSPIKSKVEKLKYPSSPLISRNNSYDSVDNKNDQISNNNNNNPNPSLANSTPIYPQLSTANVPIISPLPRKNFVGPILENVKPSPPKKSSRRPSVTSSKDDDDIPVIRTTPSTSSLKSINSVALPSSDEESTITNLDTKKVAPQNKESTSTEKKKEGSKKSQKPPNLEISSQQSPRLQNSGLPSPTRVKFSTTSSTNNNSNNISSPSSKVPSSKSSPIPITSPMASKPRISTKPYQNSPLGPGGKSSSGGSGINEVITSSSSTTKKSSPAQINNLKNSTARSVNNGTGSAKKNNVVTSARGRSNSTASVGSHKVGSDSTTDGERNSVRSNSVGNRVNSASNSIRNNRNNVGGRNRSSSTTSVGARNSAVEGNSSRNNIIGRDRSSSSASDTSISSISSTTSTSSGNSSSSIKKVIKGKVRRNSRVS